jgi:hypothetical protein
MTQSLLYELPLKQLTPFQISDWSIQKRNEKKKIEIQWDQNKIPRLNAIGPEL